MTQFSRTPSLPPNAAAAATATVVVQTRGRVGTSAWSRLGAEAGVA